MKSDTILQLGKRIVDELGLDQSSDTLGRWMAHYIAELIHTAEKAQGEDRQENLSRCANAILELWKHRHMLPSGKRPFESFEPIFRALESLDPDDNTPRYFRAARNSNVEEDDQGVETKEWLELADGLDYSARILIRYCLTRAAENAMKKSKEWIELAETLDEEEQIDLQVALFIHDENALLDSPKLNESERKQIEDRIRRLDGFLEFANTIANDLRAELKQQDATRGDQSAKSGDC